MRKLVPFSLLFLAACGPTQSNHSVSKLSPDLSKKKIDQNYCPNGHIPDSLAGGLGRWSPPAPSACRNLPQTHSSGLVPGAARSSGRSRKSRRPQDPRLLLRQDQPRHRAHDLLQRRPRLQQPQLLQSLPGHFLFGSPVPTFLHLDKKTSLVFVDQRGTGCSDFPTCRATRTRSWPGCGFTARKGIVSDAEQIRAKIWAGRKWIAFGQSYGAFIAHRYLIQAPQGLKAALAHANAISPDTYERIRDRIASQARVIETYYTQFPDDRALLSQLRAFLTPGKCFKSQDGKDAACGYDVLDSFNDMLGFTDEWLSIHQWVGAMVTPSGVSSDAIALFLSMNYFSPANPLGSQAIAMQVINWVDRGVPSFDFAHCTQIQTDLMAHGIDLSKIAVNECSDALEQGPRPVRPIVARVQALRTDLMTLESFTEALRTNSDVAFYLYSGQNDPYVPVEVFAPELKAVAGLGNLHYTNFSGSGHNGFYTEPPGSFKNSSANRREPRARKRLKRPSPLRAGHHAEWEASSPAPGAATPRATARPSSSAPERASSSRN